MDVDKTTQLYLNNEVQFFCFKLKNGGQHYAVNIYKVREVIKYKGEVTKVNHDDCSVLEGLVTVRNETMPLVDLHKWFFYDSSNHSVDLTKHGIDGDDILIMICDYSDFIVGIRIYEAERIISKKWSEVNQSSDMGMSSKAGKIVGNTKYIDGDLMQIVDVERMLVDVFPWIEQEKEQELETINSIDSQKVVLLAEDSPSAMKMMQKILNKAGVKHYDFVNGKLLLDFIFSQKIDIEDIGVVITDLEMPEASGFEVIKQMKNDSRTSKVPIVVNSSMSGDSNRNMAKKLNAEGFVSKSNPKEIEEILEKFLSI